MAADGTNVNVGGGGGDRGGGGGNSPPAKQSPLKCGIYLIAHPLMTGYFVRSIIVILDQTEEDLGVRPRPRREGGSTKEEEEEDLEEAEAAAGGACTA